MVGANDLPQSVVQGVVGERIAAVPQALLPLQRVWQWVDA
jgi:hypothetical protein